MKIEQLIDQLQLLKLEHPNSDVFVWNACLLEYAPPENIAFVARGTVVEQDGIYLE